jgi:nucleoside-diphosphate-sugar epimerase
MQILVLGGTRFVGRGIVEAALDRGHELTLFNRGSTDPDAFRDNPNVHRVRGDRRSNDISQIAESRWDAVVDVSAYGPDDIRPVLQALSDQTPQYVFISTVSVYLPNIPPGSDESAPLLQVPESIPSSDPRAYGGLKALCERELRDAAGDRLTILRPTVVIGPRDYTDRFGWWVKRIAAAGDLPVPRRLEQPVQLIDVRDLSVFAARTIDANILGTYNAVGPKEPATLGGMIAAVSAALGVAVRPVPGEDGSRFPLTLPEDGSADGLFSVSGAAAYRQGLTLRPLGDSARDVLEWESVRSARSEAMR